MSHHHNIEDFRRFLYSGIHKPEDYWVSIPYGEITIRRVRPRCEVEPAIVLWFARADGSWGMPRSQTLLRQDTGLLSQRHASHKDFDEGQCSFDLGRAKYRERQMFGCRIVRA